MKDKITIEDLAPYLPHGLRGKANVTEHYQEGFKINCNLIGIKKSIITLKCYDLSGNAWRGVEETTLRNFKPILRPLSDLTKEIEHEGERFVPIDEFFVMFGGAISLKSGHYNWKKDFVDNLLYSPYTTYSYQVFYQLIKWNFDVFGLIEKGLAIDINTLEK